jgi:hypothetical protein
MEKSQSEFVDDWSPIDRHMSSSRELSDGVDIGVNSPSALATTVARAGVQSDPGEDIHLHTVDTQSNHSVCEANCHQGTGVIRDSSQNPPQAWFWHSSWSALSNAVKQVRARSLLD